MGQIRLAAIMICGALSGLGGICFAYSISANFSSSIYVGYGYLAIAALIFGNWRILPTLGACLLFGFARSGGYRLVQVLQMPSSYQDLVMILPYVLTLLLLVFFSKQNGAPRALGVIYDNGARLAVISRTQLCMALKSYYKKRESEKLSLFYTYKLKMGLEPTTPSLRVKCSTN